MKRFAAFFCAAMTLAAFGQSAITVKPEGTHLALGQFCYTISATQNGTSKPIGVTFQSVTRQEVNGVDTLAIVVHQHMNNGKFDMRDSFLLRRDDLRPIRLDTDRNGSPYVHLDYTENRIFGWKMKGATKKPIDLVANGPVWDGNLWGETFAALPLKPATSLVLPIYQYDSGFGTFYLDVSNQHQESTAQGNFESWTMKAGLSRSEEVEYTVSTKPGLELAYTAGPSSQKLGGECGDVK